MGLDNLSKENRAIWNRLPVGEIRWNLLKQLHGGHNDAVRDFFNRCAIAGVMRKGKFGEYVKVVPTKTVAAEQPIFLDDGRLPAKRRLGFITRKVKQWLGPKA